MHGLGSNPDTTWQARRATDSGEEDVTWVSDFLPDDLHHLEAGDIRLYFFNFESFWKRDAVQVRLATIGNDFLEHMANSIRRSQEVWDSVVQIRRESSDFDLGTQPRFHFRWV